MKIGIRYLIFIILITFPEVALSQQTNTTCTNIAGTTSCNSTTNPTLGQFIDQDIKRRETTDERRAESLESATTRVERFAAQQRDMILRKKVGLLVAEGRCAEAKRLALENGELELAAATKGLCE